MIAAMAETPSDATPPKRPARIVRKAKRRSTLAPSSATVGGADEILPGFDVPVGKLVDEWTDSVEQGVEDADVFGFELAVCALGGTLAALGSLLDQVGVPGDPVGLIVSELGRRSDSTARAILGALGHHLDLGDFSAQARRVLEVSRTLAPVRPPTWYAELEQPCEVVECGEIGFRGEPQRLLLLLFSRAGVRHGIAMSIDDDECGEATEILPLVADMGLSRGLAPYAKTLVPPRTKNPFTPLDPADARFRAETALTRRAEHDADLGPEALLEEFGSASDEDGPGTPPYPAMVPLLRSRLAALPPHGREIPPHDEPDPGELEQLAGIFGQLVNRFNGGGILFGPEPRPLSSMPKKRRKKDGPAPVYRVRIDLKGAKPPIWRRIELSADISLGEMHDVIQTAFDWTDSHLHVFETEYGPFGNGGSELEHRNPATVTLEQLLEFEGDKLEYMYDFGDAWEHVIKLERVLEPKPGQAPTRTTGRRAAPPDDSGGIWGYEEDGPIGPDVFGKDDQDQVNAALATRFGNRLDR